MRAGGKYEISSLEKILMIPRNEETNSEILLQFFPVTWAKYFYDELVCQSLGSTLLVFVSNFPSFMSIGRKQHNGYQLLTFLLLTALSHTTCRPRSRCQPASALDQVKSAREHFPTFACWLTTFSDCHVSVAWHHFSLHLGLVWLMVWWLNCTNLRMPGGF